MKTTIIIIVIGFAIIIGGIVLFSGKGEQRGGERFDKAPEFTLKDYNGNDISFSDFQGKITVVNSWAVWCPFCVKELPEFARLQEEFGDEIVVIAIDRAESLEKVKGFTDPLGVTDKFVFLLDPRDSFYKSIGGFAMPETIFVDAEGFIRIHKRGPMSLKEMREKVLEVK